MSVSSWWGRLRGGLDTGSDNPLLSGTKALMWASLYGLVLGAILWSLFSADDLRYLTRALPLLLLRNQDLLWLGLVLALAVFVQRRLTAPGGIPSFPPSAWWPSRSTSAWPVPAVALAVLCFVGVGTYLFHHAFALSLDEFLAEFQTAIFRDGRVMVPLSDRWNDYVGGLQPRFLYHDTDGQAWMADYRPVYAAIRAAFSLAGIEALTNAVLTALSVLLVAAVSRRLWPDRLDAPVLAAILLASSPQVLFMGMSAYAWVGHLFFNLLWLLLFLRDDRIGHGLAALVGVLAVGLHQIHAHPLFVLPFMFGLLQQRRWPLAAFYATSYTAAIALWGGWHDVATHLHAGVQLDSIAASSGWNYLYRGTANAQDFGLLSFVFMWTHLSRFVAWQNPILIVLAASCLACWPRLPPVMRQLALGCILIVVAHLIVMPNGMHGWGYRYLHGVMGSFALMATFGWIHLTSGDGPRVPIPAARWAAAVFTLATLVIAIPLRAVQVEGFVRPMAAASRHIASLDADIVLVDHLTVWFGNDLIRNDPLLGPGRPKVLGLVYLSTGQIEALCDGGDTRVVVVDYDDLAHLGVELVDAYNEDGTDELVPHLTTLRETAAALPCLQAG